MTDEEIYKANIEALALAINSECHSKDEIKLLVGLLGLKQQSSSEFEPLIDKIIVDNPDKVKEYKEGKTKLIGYFIGQLMKINKAIDPKIANSMFVEKLK